MAHSSHTSNLSVRASFTRSSAEVTAVTCPAPARSPVPSSPELSREPFWFAKVCVYNGPHDYVRRSLKRYKQYLKISHQELGQRLVEIEASEDRAWRMEVKRRLDAQPLRESICRSKKLVGCWVCCFFAKSWEFSLAKYSITSRWLPVEDMC